MFVFINISAGWAIPFIWATIWGLITLRWCKKDLVRERIEWEHTNPSLQKIKDASGGLDPDTPSDTPPAPEDQREIESVREEIERMEESKASPEQVV